MVPQRQEVAKRLVSYFAEQSEPTLSPKVHAAVGARNLAVSFRNSTPPLQKIAAKISEASLPEVNSEASATLESLLAENRGLKDNLRLLLSVVEGLQTELEAIKQANTAKISELESAV